MLLLKYYFRVCKRLDKTKTSIFSVSSLRICGYLFTVLERKFGQTNHHHGKCIEDDIFCQVLNSGAENLFRERALSKTKRKIISLCLHCFITIIASVNKWTNNTTMRLHELIKGLFTYVYTVKKCHQDWTVLFVDIIFACDTTLLEENFNLLLAPSVL